MNEYIPFSLPAVLTVCAFMQLRLSGRFSSAGYKSDAVFMRYSAYVMFSLSAAVLIIMLF